MQRLLSMVAVGFLLAACGGSGAGPTPTGSGIDDTPTSGPDATGVGEAPGGRPSGATVRIVNVYNGGDKAASIDVYAAPWVEAGATPLLTVPYGTATEFFDPTVADDAGDMFLVFYRHGETGNGTEVMSQTETLKGGEIITYILMSDAEKRDDGTPKLYLQSLYHSPKGGAFDSTPEPGKSVLIANMHGIEPAVTAPEGTSWYLAAGGTGCKKSINDADYTLTAAGPGDGTRYVFDAGSYSLSLHPSLSDGSFPDCSTKALISGIDYTAEAGKTTVLVVYAPTATDIKSMVLPLGW
ncbi:MAG TPA: hypothetical protein VHL56_03150 [Candidatus Limnocylindrales bacterium]|nr:hypothetical protein [Candidatus Limnocylindrales bacterium]